MFKARRTARARVCWWWTTTPAREITVHHGAQAFGLEVDVARDGSEALRQIEQADQQGASPTTWC
jgi:hypothetical protein